MKKPPVPEKYVKTSYSQLRSLRRCPQQWAYKYVEHLEQSVPPAGMLIGKIGHEALAAYYRGEDWEQTLTRVREFESKQEYWNELEPAYDENEKIVQSIMPNYIKFASLHDEIDAAKVISVEQKFVVRVPGTQTKLRGYWDLVVEDADGDWWLFEHKFIKQLQAYEALEFDEQTFIYLWALRRWMKRHDIKKNIAGVLFNLVRQKPTQKDPGVWVIRQKTYRTPQQLKGVGSQLINICRYQETVRSLSKSTHSAYWRNFSQGCWDCGLRTLCIQEYKGVDCSVLRQSRFYVNLHNSRDYRRF